MSDDPPVRSSTDAELKDRRVCVIYDCLFPLTHGGAERWYRFLVDRLVESEAAVTYLTRRQWRNGAPSWTGVDVVAVSPEGQLYDADGIRRTSPAITFGVGTFFWMLRHRRSFDSVVIASFPFFSFLAARLALVGTKTPILVDYHEVWSRDYWTSYAGRVRGTVGFWLQRLCVHQTRYAQVFTEEGKSRLQLQGCRGDIVVLAGLLPAPNDSRVVSTRVPEVPTILYVGRHVRHKGVRLLPQIADVVRSRVPDVHFVIASDGPERLAVEADVAHRGLNDVVSFTGALSEEDLLSTYANASCTVVPSLREGYGIVVAESVGSGTPVVVANNPENLSTSLVDNGVNGYVVEPSVEGMAEGVLSVLRGGETLRRTCAQWSAQHSASMGMAKSADEMVTRLARL